MSISSPVSRLTRPGPLSLSLVSPRSQLFIFGWRWKCREIQPLATVTTIPRKPGQSGDQSHLVMIRQIRPALIGWNLETISWQLPGRPARPHHTITKIFYMLHHHRSSAYRSAVSAWLSTLETVIIIPPNTGRSGQGSSVSRYSPDEDLDRRCWCQSVQSYLSH